MISTKTLKPGDKVILTDTTQDIVSPWIVEVKKIRGHGFYDVKGDYFRVTEVALITPEIEKLWDLREKAFKEYRSIEAALHAEVNR